MTSVALDESEEEGAPELLELLVYNKVTRSEGSSYSDKVREWGGSIADVQL